jgi:hypothetical protein
MKLPKVCGASTRLRPYSNNATTNIERDNVRQSSLWCDQPCRMRCMATCRGPECEQMCAARCGCCLRVALK